MTRVYKNGVGDQMLIAVHAMQLEYRKQLHHVCYEVQIVCPPRRFEVVGHKQPGTSVAHAHPITHNPNPNLHPLHLWHLTHLLLYAQCKTPGCVSKVVSSVDKTNRTLCGPHLIKAGGVPAAQVRPYFSLRACMRHSLSSPESMQRCSATTE
jgi:hypothetical protein